MKKLFTMLFTMVLLVPLLLAGCGSGSKATDQSSDKSQTTGQSGDDSNTYVIKFAHEMEPSHPKGVWADEFKKAVESKSNGKIKVEVFPSGQLYADDVAASQAVMSGSIQMTAPTSGVLANTIPQFLVFDSPFLFPSLQTAADYLNSDLGKQLTEKAEGKGMKIIEFMYNSPAELWIRDKEVKSPEDLKGLKIRIFPSPVLEETIKTLHANPVTIAASELYVSIQQGVADGYLSSVTNVASAKLYETVKHSSQIHVNQNVYPVLLNKDFFDGMPEDLQQVVLDAAAETTEKNRTNLEAKIDEDLEEIKGHGVNVHMLTPEENEKWINKVEAVYKQLEEKVGTEFLNQTKEFIKNHQ